MVYKTLMDFAGTRAQGLLYVTYAKERMLAGTCSFGLSSRLFNVLFRRQAGEEAFRIYHCSDAEEKGTYPKTDESLVSDIDAR
jgi:hypothetical protein